MRELISWTVALVFYGFGLGVLQVPNSKRIIASKVFFVLGAITASGASIMSLVSLTDNLPARLIVSFCVFGLIGAGTIEAIRFAGHTQKIEPETLAETKKISPTDTLTPNKSDNTKTLQRKEPTFTEGIDTVSVTIGSNSHTMLIANLERTKSPFFIGDVPAFLYAENGKPYVDVDIYSPPPMLPVKLRHNKLLNRPAEWDMNSDEKALEIVNEKQQPVFQLYYKSPSQIIINGLFFNGYVTVLASENDLGIGTDVEKEPYPIKPIFKYPSSQHSGERR